jgi:GTPase
MKFVDAAKIFLRSGKGGAGCTSMRREKFVPFGGPNGGDGGKGGDVFFQGEPRLTSLYDLRLHPHQSAGNGKPGMGDQKAGKSGVDRIIKVPLGTVVIDDATGEICLEVLNEGRHRILEGGKGGLGNTHFKSATHQAPRYAQPGEPGQEKCVRLELKLIADVGLVGLPNAGKSTLISVISRAHPRIDDYPFTTLTPHLGVVYLDQGQSFVVADIPGIIENAHQGAGLGHRFLKHIQRTSVLAFLIDCSRLPSPTPLETFQVLCRELELFSEGLTTKERIVVLTKIDARPPEMDIQQIVESFRQHQEEVYPISSVTGTGLKKLKYRLWELVENNRLIDASNE